MNKKIYDIREDRHLKEAIVMRNKYKQVSDFEKKAGPFGSHEWWEYLQEEGCIERIRGTVSELSMSGHNDYPLFTLTCIDKKYEFERKGSAGDYAVGTKLELYIAKVPKNSNREKPGSEPRNSSILVRVEKIENEITK